jgi:hypothetical protein
MEACSFREEDYQWDVFGRLDRQGIFSVWIIGGLDEREGIVVDGAFNSKCRCSRKMLITPQINPI